MFEDKDNGHTCYCENCLKLQAEKEQLYKEKKQLQKSQYCVAYEKDCHLVCKQSGCKLKDYHKYKQCLDEIERLTKMHIQECIDFDDCYRAREQMKIVLQLINQAKEGE